MKETSAAQRGLTLVEMIITITVMGILIATVIPLFVTTQRGYTAMEVNTVLPAATQEALNKIQHRLVENKRIFGANSSFFYRLPTMALTPLDSQLPTISPNMGLSPSSSSFVAANMGNSLFFASLYSPKDYNVAVGTATYPVRIDTAMFNYYFIGLNPPQTVGQITQRVLREWHSVPYADYQQLMDISNTTKRSNTVTALYNNDGIRYAFDVSATTASSAFYTITAAGAINAAASHVLVPATDLNRPREMVDLIEGVASGGFRFGISPNTGGNFTHSKVVPLYAASRASGYPSGFEVAVVGTGSARQVFVRLVMAAQGNFKGYKGYENILLVTARDLY